MKYLYFILSIFLVVFLTLLTQVGGIVYFFSWLLYLFVRGRIVKRYWRVGARIAMFVVLYLVVIFLVMPPVAKRYGRVPLPFTKTNYVKPLTIWTALLSRNYVTPELRNVVYSVADKMHKKYPGSVINYMDANFPFRDGFPLLPHISHNDGKKLDVAFYYVDKATGKPSDKALTPIGYGGSEPPRKGEPDRPSACADYWMYSYMYGVMPLSDKLAFDEARTKEMIKLFLWDDRIGRAYLEPHLKVRMQLTSKKIGLHACYSVRHDDHVHVQVW